MGTEVVRGSIHMVGLCSHLIFKGKVTLILVRASWKRTSRLSLACKEICCAELALTVLETETFHVLSWQAGDP